MSKKLKARMGMMFHNTNIINKTIGIILKEQKRNKNSLEELGKFEQAEESANLKIQLRLLDWEQKEKRM